MVIAPEYSKYAVFVMALYRSAGSACFVKDIALWGQLESWECQNRLRERRNPRELANVLPAQGWKQYSVR